MYHYLRQSAFSLVELSVVLVILGLLTGGILGGQALIRAAELRSVSTEYSRYVAAAQSFRDKYFALPGDMPNATLFWGVQHATPSTCATQASIDQRTCDGNGNGRIEYTAVSSNEMFRYWQHLANAGLIEGTYSGVSAIPSPAGFGCIPGTNCPLSRVSNGSWSSYFLGTQIGHGQWFDGTYGNAIFFGNSRNGVTYSASGAITPEEAWNLDTKMDDGRPTIGNVVVWKNLVNNGCTTNDTNAADFVLASRNTACALIFKSS
ncbi:prepilin-type N-terminal cleavage/methylation domain-containing protein [Novosphingobium sp. B1]|uniref:prepilin-type N-terminal cleavage/methylation domain-containing protein n=1 Tax=Novosphingobium sp. B1 TaxID=1938756 RepID=UPI0009D8E986|nr:prepilin-type N-terminal cleavage/methylation domain-containing protein [Novosphingobium sp. B1]SMC59190.1 prepilin-type N-terminal cleavage/methylation domain-containing protein [Novosphingobium sp. B1]